MVKYLGNLADSLMTRPHLLRQMIEDPRYRTFQIRKKKGGYREICVPENQLKGVQRAMNRILQDLYPQPVNAYGFMVGKDPETPKDILANTLVHVGKPWVWNLDLKDFFPTITAKKLTEVFQKLPFGFPEKQSAILALLCTWKGKLPIGSPSSPILSHFACMPLDYRLSGLLEEMKMGSNVQIQYTRYADDLTFSFESKPPNELLLKIRALIQQEGFLINEKKVRLQHQYQAQWVTGIKVNAKPNLDRRYIRNIRAVLYDIRVNGVENACRRYFDLTDLTELTFEQKMRMFNSLRGKINYLGFVRGWDDPVYQRQLESLLVMNFEL